MKMHFTAIAEPEPGAAWAALFARFWPSYRRWFLSEGEEARATYLASRRALKAHMPELLETYDRLCALAGGGDLAARFLSFYCPPAYLTGCSQAVWPGLEPTLVRNYDYSPRFFDAVILHSAWRRRRVLGMSDCLWGLLDGVNEAGLAVSLTFGGRRVIGRGFGVPLILRYLLETCDTVAEAARTLQRLPIHMAYNVTLLDRAGHFATVYLSPDRSAVVTQQRVATNHQERVEWQEHARATASVERERFLLQRLTLHPEAAGKLVQAFLRPPLYATAYERGFGTLYTATYQPRLGRAEYHWPGAVWAQSLAAPEPGRRDIRFGQNDPESEAPAAPPERHITEI